MIFNINHYIYAATRQRGGFGVFYSSKNLYYLNGESLNEIEKKSNYIAPSTFREEKIENYPVNYAYYVVEDNGRKKAALLRSKYTGATNHTPDRAGNFLSHTIIFEDSLDKICLPPLFCSAPFLDHLTLEDENNFISPAENFESDQHLKKTTLAKLLQFLIDDKRRLCTMLQVIDAILDGWLKNKGHNITILAATGKEASDLIFTLYSIVPAYVINKYTFATYTYNPDRVNYKICGVIPGCITEDLTDYIKVFEIDKQSENYHPKFHFSATLFNWILNNDVERIANLERLFKDFNVEDFDIQVEIPFKIEQFKNDLSNKNKTDLYNIMTLFSPSQSKLKSELIELIRTDNPHLYLEYVEQEMRLETMRKDSLALYISKIEDYLRRIIDVADENQVFNFYKTFEENARKIYKIEIIVANLLTGFEDIKQICLSNKLLRHQMFKLIEKGWNNVVNKDVFISQHEEYLLKGNFPIINMWMKKKKIETEMAKGLFFNKINTNEEHLKKMSLEDRKNLFIEAVIMENNKGEMCLSTLNSIVSMISKFFQNPFFFWDSFFKKHYEANNDSEERSYKDVWSLSLLKRMVILMETKNGRLGRYQSFIENLDEYEIQWISDAMVILHLKEEHNAFTKMIPSKKDRGLFGWLNKRR